MSEKKYVLRTDDTFYLLSTTQKSKLVYTVSEVHGNVWENRNKVINMMVFPTHSV